MGKQTRVALFGEQRRNIVVEAGATEGAVIGQNLTWSDGTLWSLITGIPALVKSLAGLSTDGWIRKDGSSLSALDWPYVRKTIELLESLTIPTDFQLLVNEEFEVEGTLTVEAGGELVVLGQTDSNWPQILTLVAAGQSLLVKALYQVIVVDEFDIQGEVDCQGTLVIL